MLKDYLINGPITQDIISSLIARMSESTGSGAHSIFLGQVRADETEGKIVKAIEYQAYENMVKTEGDKIKNAILNEYNDVRSIDIVHSTGLVAAGEISLFILVSAGHRKQAIEACSKTVELIKDRLPVWKKELYDDASHVWQQNH
jgi:molybdopterin synthase catalytic subunit